VAVIDAPAPFRSAVRGYDRAKVDAMMRAEQAALQRLNERIAALEHHLAACRGAAFRVDDPSRKQSIRAAADLLSDAWDHARQLINAEDATADLQRNHAVSIAASHLADVTTWAEEQERRARAEADAVLAAARQEADQLRAHATDFIEHHVPMAEQLLADAAAKSQEFALAAENEVHHRVQALEADLTQRQTTADYELQTAQRLAAKLAQESSAVDEKAAGMRETGLGRARAVADNLINAVAHEIAALEEEADRGLAELAEHMATLSTQVNAARKAIAARPARAPHTKPDPQADPAPAAQPAAIDPEATAPLPKVKAAPRPRKTPAAAASGPKTTATKSARPATKAATEEAKEPAARRPAPPEAPGYVTIVANGVPTVRL
jgi:hypothetical protein